ncbi:MAG: DivIVA domain-containing protein [Anaerovorax sp.]
MITPLDIQNKEFPKGVRGYKEEDVDSFLDLLTLDFEKLLDENQRLKDTIRKQNVDLARYQNSEGAVLNTLEAAKSLMGDISASAERRAEILLKNAELDAQLIQREAKESVERLTEEAAAMRSRLNAFKAKYKGFLEDEQRSLDSLGVELFLNQDSEDFKFFDALKNDYVPTIKTSGEKEKENMNKTIINFK